MKTLWSMIMAALVISGMSAGAQTVCKSTDADRTAVEVTVYNNNLGFIKETRSVDIPAGRGELRYMDVPAHIMPATIHVKSLDDPKGLAVLEQHYEYDLINPTKLLDKYVGKKIRIVDWNKFRDRKDEIEAILLSNNEGQVFKIDNRIYLGHPGIKVLPELPEDLVVQPTLTWLYQNTAGRKHRLEASYLTSNLNWNADYVAVVNKDDTFADISGWVTVDNKSGASYKDARLKLVAGEVQRVGEEEVEMPPVPERMMRMDQMVAGRALEEKPFFEYHLYDLQRTTTLKDNQTKQISLLDAGKVKMEKELLVYGAKHYLTMPIMEPIPRQPVTVHLKFKNSKENNMGIPLPAGIMRVYKADDSGGGRFAGEDRIEHTAKDEEVKLKLGRAFDVVAERTQTDYKQLTTRMHESEWEITIRNHKDKEVSVGIIEPLLGSWTVVSKSAPYQKIDAFTIRFDVKVPKDGEAKMKYRVKVGL
ncbi:MAG: DUF4139 domain-containing protein [Desulfomonile sp.]|nr:DUF4139 domain-containing protein [Desulfomonile sp.]